MGVQNIISALRNIKGAAVDPQFWEDVGGNALELAGKPAQAAKGILPSIYSGADSMKRRLADVLRNPVLNASRTVGQAGDDLRMVDELQSKAFGDPSNPFNITDKSAFNELAGKYQNSVMNFAPIGATVWHGSPHKFDKFDSSKIGTGEGAQAYGHGLYLAESPDVAKMYREKLTDPAFNAAGANAAKARLNEKIAKRIESTDTQRAAKLRADVASLSDPAGAIYKVDLPDDQIAKMLDWDKPLSGQSKDVRDTLGKLGYGNDVAGRDVISSMQRKASDISDLSAQRDALISKYQKKNMSMSDAVRAMNPEDRAKFSAIANGIDNSKYASSYVSNELRQAGIPGIRYLDQGSRGAGQGSSNFVVFPGNESILKILERNGQVPGLLGSP